MRTLLASLLVGLGGCSFSGSVEPNFECTTSCDDEKVTCYDECETECSNPDNDSDESCDTDCTAVCDTTYDDCSVGCTAAE
jgi:hypothetical protein